MASASNSPLLRLLLVLGLCVFVVKAFTAPQPPTTRLPSARFNKSARRTGMTSVRDIVVSTTGPSPSSLASSLHEFDEYLQETETGLVKNNDVGRRTRRMVGPLSGARNQAQNHVRDVSASVVGADTLDELESEFDLEETVTSDEESTGLVFDDNEFDPMLQKIQQHERGASSFKNWLSEADISEIALTLVVPSVIAFAGFRWGAQKVKARVEAKLEATLESFANEMIYHDGDFDEMKLCKIAYGRKLALLPKRNNIMLKHYLENFAKKRVVSPQAISSLSFVFTLFGLSEEKAAAALSAVCDEGGTDKLASASKLLFLGTRVFKSPEAIAALKPVKDLIMSTYPDVDIGETLLDAAQNSIAEAAYRNSVREREKLGQLKDKSIVPDGWDVLGIGQARALDIYKEERKNKFVTEAEEIYGQGGYKVNTRGQRVDSSGKLLDKQDIEDEERVQAFNAVNKGQNPKVGKVYKCGNCGNTVYVPKTKTFERDFPDDYVCFVCTASKETFSLVSFDEEKEEDDDK